MIPRKLSPKAEELLARIEARDGKGKRNQAKPAAVFRSAPIDPTWPFPSAPMGALATENPLGLVVGKKR